MSEDSKASASDKHCWLTAVLTVVLLLSGLVYFGLTPARVWSLETKCVECEVSDDCPEPIGDCGMVEDCENNKCVYFADQEECGAEDVCNQAEGYKCQNACEWVEENNNIECGEITLFGKEFDCGGCEPCHECSIMYNCEEKTTEIEHDCIKCEGDEWVEKDNPYEHECIECEDEDWEEKPDPFGHDCKECENSNWFSGLGFGSWEWVENPPTECHECEGGEWEWGCPDPKNECGERTGCEGGDCVYEPEPDECNIPSGGDAQGAECYYDFSCCEWTCEASLNKIGDAHSGNCNSHGHLHQCIVRCHYVDSYSDCHYGGDCGYSDVVVGSLYTYPTYNERKSNCVDYSQLPGECCEP